MNIKRNKKQIKNAILESLRGGSSVKDACKGAGVGRTTFYNWMMIEPHFEKAVEQAKLARVHIVEDALMANCLKGNVVAQIFFLKNKGGYTEGESRTNVNVINNVNGKYDRKPEYSEEERELQAEADRRLSALFEE